MSTAGQEIALLPGPAFRCIVDFRAGGSQRNPTYRSVPVNHGPNEYSVAHGTRIYYVARDGSTKGFGDYADAPAQMIQKFKEYQ